MTHVAEVNGENAESLVKNCRDWIKQNEKSIHVWAKREAANITCCDGEQIANTRLWLDAISRSRRTIPSNYNEVESVFLDELICRTSTKFLRDAYIDIRSEIKQSESDERCYAVDEVLKRLSDEFLSKEERRRLQDELPKQKQRQEEDVSAYGRRFSHAARAAYGNSPNEKECELITGTFVAGLKNHYIRDLIFQNLSNFNLKDIITESIELEQ